MDFTDHDREIGETATFILSAGSGELLKRIDRSKVQDMVRVGSISNALSRVKDAEKFYRTLKDLDIEFDEWDIRAFERAGVFSVKEMDQMDDHAYLWLADRITKHPGEIRDVQPDAFTSKLATGLYRKSKGFLRFIPGRAIDDELLKDFLRDIQDERVNFSPMELRKIFSGVPEKSWTEDNREMAAELDIQPLDRDPNQLDLGF
jgi:hypothetical protein